MKKMIPGVFLLFFFASFNPVKSQDPHCPDLQERMETAEKEQKQLASTLSALEYSISIMEDEVPDMNSLREELMNTEHAIPAVQARIAGGDNSAEAATELTSLRNRAELLRMRMGKDFNKATFYNQPKFRQLQKDLSGMKSKEFEIKLVIADLETKLKAYGCPRKPKKGVGDIGDIVELDDDWPGNWKFTTVDERMTTSVTMVLNRSSAGISGTMTVTAEEINMKYHVKGCSENTPGKLSCSYTTTAEDYEKHVDLKGTVTMTLAPNTLKTSWQEVGAPVVRWKPTATPREYIPKAPGSFKIDFKRQ